LVALLALLVGPAHANDCEPSPGAYRLYRSSSALPDARLRIATFDAPDGAAYNSENCPMSARLRMAQPGVVVRYWCEPVG
jgi:hypothetical protein